MKYEDTLPYKIISDTLPACARKLSPLEMHAIHFDLVRRTLITADMLERERINTWRSCRITTLRGINFYITANDF